MDPLQLLLHRVEREKLVFAAMVRLRCARRHSPRGRGGRGGLCPRCAALVAETRDHLERCPHGDRKPSCTRCDRYCFAPHHAARIRAVMLDGARWFFPARIVLALLKLVDALLLARGTRGSSCLR